jgi:ABC-type Mn2+/Zn2+ transport system permease subunit
MGWILLHVGLALAIFLLVLNGHLRKPNKLQIDVALGVLWLSLAGVGFFLFGGKLGWLR